MNYGRFFRLNQSISNVVDGIVIYDYIDLPAYFGPSEENKMSPKYPVNVTITYNSVIFRLHYSVYKVNVNGEPVYGYNVEDIKDYIGCSAKGAQTAHMEEIIFELPYFNDATDRLTATIKELYNTKFPQKIETEGLSNSFGGRFLEQLIRKRFPAGGEIKAGVMEKEMYGAMQKALDTLPSYSTLWLMDLLGSSSDSEEKFIDIYDKKGGHVQGNKNRDITGFLRKLLLDFMFDMKHSDVFQNCRYYDQMYSGLMSDFYFSALIHKCEYYYYRRLIREVIDVHKDDMESVKNRITTLYADELFRAEELWLKDIMSQDAEAHFEYRNNSGNKYTRELTEKYDFSCWPSWFAEPEEEMRRVCFTMKEKDNCRKITENDTHICNSFLLTELLKLEEIGEGNNAKNEGMIAKMIYVRYTNYKQISQWFLKRYSFNDVLHLHLYKHANPNLFFLLFVVLVSIIAFGVDLRIGVIGLFFFILCSCLWRLRKFKMSYRGCDSPLTKKRNIIVYKRVLRSCKISFWFLIILCVGFLLEKETNMTIWNGVEVFISNIPLCFLFIATIMLLSVLYVITPKWKEIKTWRRKIPSQLEPKIQHMMSNLHLLLPRLVASITASWITLSMGFDLYVAFFDSRPAVPTIIVLLVILLLFVMFEVNKVTPNSNSWIKLYRSIELIVISYSISLIIGIIVINFLGERYLEKGGYVGEGEFYKQYVVHEKRGFKVIGEKGEVDSSYFGNNVKALRNVYHTDNISVKFEYPLVEHIEFFGKDILVLRDFLVMFAFIAMFMGIFIQLIIFGDNKQMTEL